MFVCVGFWVKWFLFFLEGVSESFYYWKFEVWYSFEGVKFFVIFDF